MRVQTLAEQGSEAANYFSEFLIRIGEGTEKYFNKPNEEFNYLINVPENMISNESS